ncbi:XIAP-associated factor 1 [Lampris incognitus]|uniref:XIAP-associated factor 1 n=1 Tax=Lampris incognitus TaxID=2546036 RepID=UPI0024B4E7BB|nr:XIAP-associated factor 1 [Lampris incognitus]
MDDKQATRVCNLCHKEVAEANFDLHESHCRRYLCLCPDCNEPVNKEHLDQHRLDEHTQVRCSKCSQKVDRCHLTDHESSKCEERLQGCDFCQLEVPWKTLQEHTMVCGSRTEMCLECRQYVTLKDQVKHTQTCPATETASAAPDTPIQKSAARQKTLICEGCMASFPAKDINEHKLECFSRSRRGLEMSENRKKQEAVTRGRKEREEGDTYGAEASPRLSSSLKAITLSDRPRKGDLEDGDQISSCPYCHLALPQLTLRWHQAKCKVHIRLK